MSWIGTWITDLLEEGRREVRYNARREARKAGGSYFKKARAKVAEKLQPKVEEWTKNHPTKAHLAEEARQKKELLAAAKQVKEEMSNTDHAPAEAVIEQHVEKIRRIEID